MKQIEDFFPRRDVDLLKAQGCKQIADILDSNDEDGIRYILEIFKTNKLKVYGVLADNFKNQRSSCDEHNLNMHYEHIKYYKCNENDLESGYGAPPHYTYNNLLLPNCFIDYIRNLDEKLN